MNYHFFQADVLSRRAVPVGVIAAFHALIAYILLTALVQPAPAPPEPRIKATVTLDPIPEPAKPPVDVRIQKSTTAIPVPRPPDVSPPENTAQNAPAAVPVDGDGGGSATVVGPLPIRQIGSNVLPNSVDFYPPSLVRENVQGATNLRVCVDAQGARQGEAIIEQTSGNALLDRAALEMARHGRYARAMQGDTPVGNCYRFRITFRIPK